MSKKGFQLSVNVLVIIILGLVLVGTGFFLVSRVITEGNEIITDVNENLQEQIRSACFLEGNIICLLEPHARVNVGKHTDFYLGFVNELEESEFTVRTSYNVNSPAGPSPNGEDPEDYFIHIFANSASGATLLTNDEYFLPMRFSADKSLPTGEYWFDVEICIGSDTGKLPATGCESSSWTRYGSKQRIFVVIE